MHLKPSRRMRNTATCSPPSQDDSDACIAQPPQEDVDGSLCDSPQSVTALPMEGSDVHSTALENSLENFASPRSSITEDFVFNFHNCGLAARVKDDASSSKLTDTPGASTALSRISDAKVKMRGHVVKEILDTERRYMSHLLIIQRHFYNPLLERVGTPAQILPKDAIASIFSNLDEIVKVNTELLRQLEHRINGPSWDPRDGCLGDIFQEMGHYLKAYARYHTNFTNSVAVLSQQMHSSASFRQFLQAPHALPELMGLRLDSLIVMPIQRLPRYRLLLRALLDCTDVKCKDHLTLSSSLDLISDVVAMMDEKIQKHQMSVAMLRIQRSLHGFNDLLLVPGRRLIRQGPVMKVCRKAEQSRFLFLFSDILIYAHPLVPDVLINVLPRTIIDEQRFAYPCTLHLDLCRIESVPDSNGVRNIFQILGPQRSFAMYTRTSEEKQVWVEAIGSAIADLKRRRQSFDGGTSSAGSKTGGSIRSRRMNSIDSTPGDDVERLHFSAPVWVPDKQAKDCTLCHVEFGVFIRKHHCRNCGKIVCHSCSSNLFVVPAYMNKPEYAVRSCDHCIKILRDEGVFRVIIGGGDGAGATSPISATDRRFSFDFGHLSSPSSMAATQVAHMRNSVASDITVTDEALHVSSETRNRCFLCLSQFGFFVTKHVCISCDGDICAECIAKSAHSEICDVCAHGIDPTMITVDQNGGGWSLLLPESV